MTNAADELPDEVGLRIDELVAAAGIRDNRALVRQIVADGIGLGREDTDRLDLKISAAALGEMRAAFRIFAPYRDIRKVTVFGSARIKQDDPLYHSAQEVAMALAGHGWMAVTGAGPGIMQAAAEGAGSSMSLGVSIRLPFEESPNAVVTDGDNLASMKYFFTRKLMLIKESSGFVCLPGGFGTLDETFELFTLQQTGKAEPMPIVLLDGPGGGYWQALRRFVETELAPAGLVASDDLDRVLITDSAEAAVAEITGFWRNYHSLRWVGDRLVLRLRANPTDGELDTLNDQFGFLLRSGAIERAEPFPPERADGDVPDLPRLAMRLDQRGVGSLHRLIRALNALPSAPAPSP